MATTPHIPAVPNEVATVEPAGGLERAEVPTTSRSGRVRKWAFVAIPTLFMLALGWLVWRVVLWSHA